jgi:hypothetical protein
MNEVKEMYFPNKNEHENWRVQKGCTSAMHFGNIKNIELEGRPLYLITKRDGSEDCIL